MSRESDCPLSAGPHLIFPLLFLSSFSLCFFSLSLFLFLSLVSPSLYCIPLLVCAFGSRLPVAMAATRQPHHAKVCCGLAFVIGRRLSRRFLPFSLSVSLYLSILLYYPSFVLLSAFSRLSYYLSFFLSLFPSFFPRFVFSFSSPPFLLFLFSPISHHLPLAPVHTLSLSLIRPATWSLPS